MLILLCLLPDDSRLEADLQELKIKDFLEFFNNCCGLEEVCVYFS